MCQAKALGTHWQAVPGKFFVLMELGSSRKLTTNTEANKLNRKNIE